MCWQDEEQKAGKVPRMVPWKDFLNGFLSFFEMRATGKEIKGNLKFRCLKAVLEVNKPDEGVPKGFVALSKFERFLSWFGPLLPNAKDGENLFASIVNLLKQPWFHGAVDAQEAARRIDQSKISNGNDFDGLRFAFCLPVLTVLVSDRFLGSLQHDEEVLYDHLPRPQEEGHCPLAAARFQCALFPRNFVLR